ncbi:hypothetical protein AEGHOMDF_1589 [Methylobacterium soli]|nr:hypothetical protein AEGHOMDF_1589 [Methylobacterium soli]
MVGGVTLANDVLMSIEEPPPLTSGFFERMPVVVGETSEVLQLADKVLRHAGLRNVPGAT